MIVPVMLLFNGSKGYKYSGSNTFCDVAWYDENVDSKTHPVGTKSSNELGVYDMSGNVREWCNDRMGDYLIKRCEKNHFC